MLAQRIRRNAEPTTAADWEAIKPLIGSFWDKVQAKVLPHQSPGRLKQWLGMMQRNYPQAETLYAEIRELKRAPEISTVFRHALLPVQ